MSLKWCSAEDNARPLGGSRTRDREADHTRRRDRIHEDLDKREDYGSSSRKRNRQEGNKDDRFRSHHHDERARPRSVDRHDKDGSNSRSSHRHASASRDHERDRGHRSRHREKSEEKRERKALKRAEKLKEFEDSATGNDDEAAAHRTAVAELMMYSAEDNPFNDANLGQHFTWVKKAEKERKQGLTKEEAERRDLERRREAMQEIEKLNAKRAERERQAALREEEEARMARLAESAQMAGWVAKEDDFHLEQAKRRAVIRVKENRAKPIDLLSLNLKWADPAALTDSTSEGGRHIHHEEDDDEAGLEIDLDEPYNIFENLTIEEMKELHEDIQMYLALEKSESNLEFWKSMIIVCDDKLEELNEVDGAEGGSQFLARSRLDPDERSRINSMLSSKSIDDLNRLQEQVRTKLACGEPLDVEYWERVLKSIVVWRAKAKLRDMHEAVLSNRIEYLRRKQRDEASRQHQDLWHQISDDVGNASNENTEPSGELVGSAALLADESAACYNPDEMEPAPVDVSRLGYEERHLPVNTLRDELERLVEARRKVVDSLFIPKARRNDGEILDGENAEERLFMQEASKALDVEEEVFKGDEVLTHQTYQWEDKYRPRKPRYFNRVHTGFEWNKYNQTHYDSDNPPPKTVQGYKFNIFYPDLIDKTTAPTYKIIKEPGNGDTVLLRFSAGPPYEDIAFRIVNKDWEFGHKRGFRNSFDRGILQLHFNFKRLRYRK